MPLDFNLIQTIASLLGGSGIIGGGTYLFNRHKKRIIVKFVTKADDLDIDDFIILYDEVIEDNTRITPDEITKFIGNHNPTAKIKLCDYLYLCIKEKKIIGFLKFMYCHNENYLFIAYLGIDKKTNQARREATTALYSKLKKLLKKKFKNCKAIFFEVEHSADKKSTCMAKLRLFKNATKRFKLPCYKFDINYAQPEIPSDKGSLHQERTELVFVPLGRNLNRYKTVSKELMLEYLGFIYQKIYARVYDDRELNLLYQNYLAELLQKHKNELPEIITLS